MTDIEIEQMRAALKLAKDSLNELIADPETDFGPAYSGIQQRQADALKAVKKALKIGTVAKEPAADRAKRHEETHHSIERVVKRMK